MVERYGLPKDVFYKVIGILKKFSCEIEEAVLFGSRATGNYKQTSDVDIAIKFRRGSDKLYHLKDELEQQNIIYTFDIIDYKGISNEELRRRIDREGRLIFSTNVQGEVVMNAEKVNDKITVLGNALAKLQESLARDYTEDDIIIDATIKRFEFTYELSWKLMRAYLEYNGNLEGVSPRRAIQEAFKEGLIKDGEGWLQMLQDRNLTSHTYDEETAIRILTNIRDRYAGLIVDLYKGTGQQMARQG